jgi:di/tricarboxylate transporter
MYMKWPKYVMVAIAVTLAFLTPAAGPAQQILFRSAAYRRGDAGKHRQS